MAHWFTCVAFVVVLLLVSGLHAKQYQHQKKSAETLLKKLVARADPQMFKNHQVGLLFVVAYILFCLFST